jgi:hypothetical protein
LQRILEDFVELHSFPKQYVAGATIKLAGGVGSFDFAKHTLLLDIHYRPDNGGNLAKAFLYEGHRIWPTEQLNERAPAFREYADASREFNEASARRFKAVDKSFLGFFDVVWIVDGAICKPDSVEVNDVLWSLVAGGPPPNTCYAMLKALMESGVVWRFVDGKLKVGEMRLVKKKWQWFMVADTVHFISKYVIAT